MITSKRIGNLQFSKASYLCKEPTFPAYHIDMWYPNTYYGKDDEYPEDPYDSNFRLYPDNPNVRVHKECFKKKETSFAIAAFEYDNHEGCYQLEFVGDRPLEYLNTQELRETFWELLKYGDRQLKDYLKEIEEDD